MNYHNQYDSHEGHHMLTSKRSERSSAKKIMGEAGGLFNVDFLPAAFNSGGCLITPRDEDGRARHRFVVRTDTKDILGLHGAGYAATSGYHYLAEMADTLFPESTTSCTVFGAGEKIAITQDLIAPVDIGDGDVIQPQVCWISSLNGRWSTSVYDLTSRLFCQNQLVGQPLVKVKHTKNHDALLDMRVRILEGAAARARNAASMARVLKDQVFTDIQFHELVGMSVKSGATVTSGWITTLFRVPSSIASTAWCVARSSRTVPSRRLSKDRFHWRLKRCVSCRW